jgi:competence protein ComEA
MLKKMLLALTIGCALLGSAWATVDVNTADAEALQTVRGVGPARAAAIVDARTKGGPFKDGADLATRVDGIGAKSVTKLEEAGLSYGKVTPTPTAKKPGDKGSIQAKAKTEVKK